MAVIMCDLDIDVFRFVALIIATSDHDKLDMMHMQHP